MSRSIGRGVIAVMWLLLAVGCEPRHNGAVVADVSPSGWNKTDTLELHYNSLDTLTKRTIWVVARVEADRSHTPITLWVECMAPDSLCLEGEVLLKPQTHKGGSFVELRAPWIEKAVPQRKGEYRFRVAHSQEKPLTDIWSVGVEIF